MVRGWILPVDLTWASEVALKAVAKHPSAVLLCFYVPEHGPTYCLSHIMVTYKLHEGHIQSDFLFSIQLWQPDWF